MILVTYPYDFVNSHLTYSTGKLLLYLPTGEENFSEVITETYSHDHCALVHHSSSQILIGQAVDRCHLLRETRLSWDISIAVVGLEFADLERFVRTP
jgi:hypothetical protein